ncbi:MAG: FtsX-like permease family protein, partial [Chloroflexota bacterium]
MIALLWLSGLLSRRSGRLLGAMVGVALTVGLLAAIGSFIATSAATMTRRAIADVPVDWQIQLVPGASVNRVLSALGQSTGYTTSQTAGYADVAGLVAQTNGTVQTTGPGKALGLGPGYRQAFPTQIRPLVGSADGVLLAQQTAANLHAKVGDTIMINRVGLPPVSVRVNGVVDLPNADSLFQAIGVPAGAAPQAPPDNVVILPMSQWHQIFDPQATARPDSVRIQLHVRLAHNLPADPGAAYVAVQQRAHNLEARIAGSGIVGDNLAARFDGARSDALYARVLFLFLGLPGVILAALLTFTIAASGQDRRRREQALLRVRGAPAAQILRLAALEALLVGLGGVIGGTALALVVARLGSAGGATPASAWWWTAGAALTGALLTVGAVVYPAWRQLRQPPGAAARTIVGRARPAWWQRMYLDILLLVAAAVAFFQVASSGYQVVVAPEGVAQSSVSYQSFIAPVCLWIGVALLAVRVWEYGLQNGRGLLTRLLRPLGHELSGVVAASLGRQRVLLTRGVVLVALAFSFAISTAVFNTTYNAQSRVDAQLT